MGTCLPRHFHFQRPLLERRSAVLAEHRILSTLFACAFTRIVSSRFQQRAHRNRGGLFFFWNSNANGTCRRQTRLPRRFHFQRPLLERRSAVLAEQRILSTMFVGACTCIESSLFSTACTEIRGDLRSDV